MGRAEFIFSAIFWTFFSPQKACSRWAFLAKMAPKMAHRAAGKGRRPAFFAPMCPPYHPRGLGAGLGPVR